MPSEMNRMKYFLILIFITYSSGLFSQDISTKPISTCKPWIEEKKSIKEIKKILKKEYSILIESDTLIQFTKKDEKGERFIKCLFKDGVISNFTLNYPIEYRSDFTSEIINDLGFSVGIGKDGQGTGNGPEFMEFEQYFKSGDTIEILVLIINNKTNRVLLLQPDKVATSVKPNFQ